MGRRVVVTLLPGFTPELAAALVLRSSSTCACSLARSFGTTVAMYARSGALDATVRHDTVTEELIEAVHERGGRVYAWTVNTRAGIAQMRALGVDAVITDDPRLFREPAEASGPGGSIAPPPVQ